MHSRHPVTNAAVGHAYPTALHLEPRAAMPRICRILLFSLALHASAAVLHAQESPSRLISTPVGVLAGAAGGGYVSVAIVVLEARFGRYVHDIDDVLGWRTAPFVIGAVAGGVLGFYSPDRLTGAILYGAGSLGAGALIGLAVGNAIWEPPEGRWAGAAIGAGIGLVIGTTVGILNPIDVFNDGDDDGAVAAGGVPVMIRIPL